MRETIRHECERQALRALLLEGATGGPCRLADAAYFARLRERAAG